MQVMRPLCCFALVCTLLGCQVAVAVPFLQFKAAHVPSDVTLLDRSGKAIANRRVDDSVRRLPWVTLNEISPALIEALLVAEDKRFFSHSGVDWTAAIAALWQQWQAPNAAKQRGASSISMQVAAMLNDELQRQPAGRTAAEKFDQMLAAIELERHWSKAQILEAYLNTVYFRGELQGIAATTWALFSKAPSGLNKQEAAIMAALIRGPNAAPRVVAKRACLIVKQTRGAGSPCDIDDVLVTLSTSSKNPQPITNIAAHAATQLITSAAGVTLQGAVQASSLDANVQQIARSALREQLMELTHKGVEDGAIVVLDNASGDVLAYVGSSGALSQAAQVDGVVARRQAGSTLKPFLYALALEQRRLTGASLLDDAPLSVATAAGLYVPRNYDSQFVGPVSVRKALASSLNIPAVRALQITGIEPFHNLLNKLGLKLDRPAEQFGLSLALGSADIRLVDLANAYRTLANGGLYSPTRMVAGHAAHKKDSGPQRVLSEQAAWMVGNMLSDNAARSATFGFDSVLATPFWTAVKTGTSKDMRDNWCVGYSMRYTVAVWVGNASGKPMANVSGVSGAAPAWADVMRYLHASDASNAASKALPVGLVKRQVKFDGDIEPSRTEWFVADMAPKLFQGASHAWVQLAQPNPEPKIVYPQNGALIAWDPDIPARFSAITAQHTGASQFIWELNGQRLDSNRIALSVLKPGRNTLLLLSVSTSIKDSTVELDRSTFSLRGLPK